VGSMVKCSGHRVGVRYWAGVTALATFVSPRVAAVCTLEKDRYHLHIMWSTMQVLTAASVCMRGIRTWIFGCDSISMANGYSRRVCFGCEIKR
jgi:hypothetical protein